MRPPRSDAKFSTGARTYAGTPHLVAVKTILITQAWRTNIAQRDAELQECELRNRATFGSGYHPVTSEGERTTFGDLLTHCGAGLNIIANSDIYLTTHTLAIIEAWYAKGGRDRYCMALSRWDVLGEGELRHHAHRDSQDTWIILGKPSKALIHAASAIPMGVPGSDNRLCAIFVEQGYTLINPSKTVRTYHVHTSGYRTYGTGRGGTKRDTVPGPYHFVNPTAL